MTTLYNDKRTLNGYLTIGQDSYNDTGVDLTIYATVDTDGTVGVEGWVVTKVFFYRYDKRSRKMHLQVASDAPEVIRDWKDEVHFGAVLNEAVDLIKGF